MPPMPTAPCICSTDASSKSGAARTSAFSARVRGSTGRLNAMQLVTLVTTLLALAACGRDASGRSGQPSVARTDLALDTAAIGLEVPWAMDFAPDGRLFVTERPARIRVVEHGTLRREPWATLSVDAIGEDGLMGIAIAPDFATTHFAYVVG